MQAPERLICGVDPGTYQTGIAVLEQRAHVCKPCYVHTIRLSRQSPLEKRLASLYEQLCEVSERFAITHYALEKIFVHTNVQTGLVLGHARGVIMAWGALQGYHFHEFTARQVKQSMTGFGAADKAQMIHMVQHVIGWKGTLTADSADAAAVAWTLAQHLSSEIPKAPPSAPRSHSSRRWSQHDINAARIRSGNL